MTSQSNCSPPILDYKIIETAESLIRSSDETRKKHEDNVNKYLNDGYELGGELVVKYDKLYYKYYYQPLIKRNTINKCF